MFELALHILDLVQNSIVAGARLIEIRIEISLGRDLLTLSISDDGRGMDEALRERVVSPFETTRTTRKVGLGIPMFKQLSEMCEGDFSLESAPGKGTRIMASFLLHHIDRPPLGDLAGTMRALLAGCPEELDFRLAMADGTEAFEFDTREIKDVLGGVPLDAPEVSVWIGEYLSEGIAPFAEKIERNNTEVQPQ